MVIQVRTAVGVEKQCILKLKRAKAPLQRLPTRAQHAKRVCIPICYYYYALAVYAWVILKTYLLFLTESLDLTPEVYNRIADPKDGIVRIRWCTCGTKGCDADECT